MLLEIKTLLQQRQQMTLLDLARHFYVSENMMQSMLEQWLKKGKIEKLTVSSSCSSGCGGCNESSDNQFVYRWRAIAQKPIFTKTS